MVSKTVRNLYCFGNGYYSVGIKIDLDTPSGMYYVLAGSGGFSCKSETFQYVNNNQALEALNQSTTTQQLADWLTQYGEQFGVDMDAHNALGDKKERQEQGVIDMEPFSTIAAFSAAYQKMMAILHFEDLSGSEAGDYLKNQEAVLGLQSLPYYQELNDNARLAAFLLEEKPFANPADFDIKASVGCRIKLLKTLRWNSQSLEDVLTTLAEDLENEPFQLSMDMDGYRELASNQEETSVLQAITGIDFNTAEEFVNDFQQTVSNAEKQSGSGSGSGSGSSGSSSGSSSSSKGNSGGTVIIGSGNLPGQDTETDQTEASQFSDHASVSWAEESINAMAQRGIINGRTETTFEPNAPVKRAEFVKMLLLSFDLYHEGSAASFNDVSEADWYYSYAACAQENGIVTGDDEGNFNGEDPISREDAAVMLDRVMEKTGVVISSGQVTEDFSDQDQISSYAAFRVERLHRQGVISGVGDNLFAPKNSTTRAEAAKMLYAVIQDK